MELSYAGIRKLRIYGNAELDYGIKYIKNAIKARKNRYFCKLNDSII